MDLETARKEAFAFLGTLGKLRGKVILSSNLTIDRTLEDEFRQVIRDMYWYRVLPLGPALIKASSDGLTEVVQELSKDYLDVSEPDRVESLVGSIDHQHLEVYRILEGMFLTYSSNYPYVGYVWFSGSGKILEWMSRLPRNLMYRKVLEYLSTQSRDLEVSPNKYRLHIPPLYARSYGDYQEEFAATNIYQACLQLERKVIFNSVSKSAPLSWIGRAIKCTDVTPEQIVLRLLVGSALTVHLVA